MMDAFVVSITWRNMVFARTANGEIWRFWLGDAGGPYIERLIAYRAEWDEPVRLLERASLRNEEEEDIIRVYDPTTPFVEPRRRTFERII